MTAAVRKLLDEANALDARNRIELVEALLDSIGKVDPSVDAAWSREAASRLDAWRHGKLDDESLDEALSRIRRSVS